MGSFVGSFMMFVPLLWLPSPEVFRRVITAAFPGHLEGGQQIILTQGISFMTRTLLPTLNKQKSVGLQSPSLLFSSSFCLHMCVHIIWRQAGRLAWICHHSRAALHSPDGQGQQSAGSHTCLSTAASQFISSAPSPHSPFPPPYHHVAPRVSLGSDCWTLTVEDKQHRKSQGHVPLGAEMVHPFAYFLITHPYISK